MLSNMLHLLSCEHTLLTAFLAPPVLETGQTNVTIDLAFAFLTNKNVLVYEQSLQPDHKKSPNHNSRIGLMNII